MNKQALYYFFFIISLLAAVHGTLQAQNNNISLQGKVYDARSRTVLPGATVHIIGTTHEVVTDKNGEFRFITGQHPPFVILVSFVGYQTRQDTVTNTGAVAIYLQESSSQLNDVVVVGYGTQTRKSLIGSIA